MSGPSIQPSAPTPQTGAPAAPGETTPKKISFIANSSPAIQSLPPEEAQKVAVLVVMLMALINSLVVGSNGLVARSKGLSTINNAMLQLEGMIAQNKLVDVPDVQGTNEKKWNWAKAHYTHQFVQTNQGDITNQETINRDKMQAQAVVNLRIGQLQQAAGTEDTDANSAVQSLQMVVQQITYSLEVMKDLTFQAALTKAPS